MADLVAKIELRRNAIAVAQKAHAAETSVRATATMGRQVSSHRRAAQVHDAEAAVSHLATAVAAARHDLEINLPSPEHGGASLALRRQQVMPTPPRPSPVPPLKPAGLAVGCGSPQAADTSGSADASVPTVATTATGKPPATVPDTVSVAVAAMKPHAATQRGDSLAPPAKAERRLATTVVVAAATAPDAPGHPPLQQPRDVQAHPGASRESEARQSKVNALREELSQAVHSLSRLRTQVGSRLQCAVRA